MNTGLQGRVALITGGSKGIGLSIAQALAAEGADLAICARGAEALDEAAARLRETGVQVLAVPTDVKGVDAIEHFVAAAAQRFGRIDVLVNNAVTSTQDSFEALSD